MERLYDFYALGRPLLASVAHRAARTPSRAATLSLERAVDYIPEVGGEDHAHVTITTSSRIVHVIPLACFQRIAAGEQPITQLDDWEAILRAILTDWITDLLDEANHPYF